MIVKHFDIRPPQKKPPWDEGWEPTWYGYFEMTKCESAQRRTEYTEIDRAIRTQGKMTEADFERDCFLSILTDIKRKHINMFELGAGWGRMCLALAGVIDFKITPIIPSSYRCLAVEAEPTHYQWIKEHFEVQGINGAVVQGAVSNKTGTCRFNASPDPESCYGQAISPLFSSRKVPSIAGIRNIITGRSIKVKRYTVDWLAKYYEFDHIDIVDVDVQGAECEVVDGAAQSIKNNLIDYWLIGTHHKKLNDALRIKLSHQYDLVIDIYPNSLVTINGFKPVECHDGIQLFKRKSL